MTTGLREMSLKSLDKTLRPCYNIFLESLDEKFLVALIAVATLAGCAKEADWASYNLSVAADQFEVTRRIVFYNGITGGYMLEISGLCSLGNRDSYGELSVTCKVGPSEYKKHFLGLSDNVTYFVEQIAPNSVNRFQYRVIFNPLSIIPDIELQK